MSDKPANTPKTGKRGGKTKTSWKPGQSGNPKGAPKRGQSWAEIIKEVGEMTPDEARAACQKIFAQVPLHDPITLKQAVVMRIYAAMLFEPQPGLVNAFMDREDGKVAQPVDMNWKEQAKANGIDPDKAKAAALAAVRAAVDGSNDGGGDGGDRGGTGGEGGTGQGRQLA